MKSAVEQFVLQPDLIEQVLGSGVDHRCIVLVQRTDEHSLGLRTCNLGQSRSPFVVRLISDLAPVDRHDHDRGLLSQEDKPVQFQSIADRLRLRGEYAHATMSKRDRRVDLKVSEFGCSRALVRSCLVRDGLANAPQAKRHQQRGEFHSDVLYH